jgi:hypothetical protein
MEEQKIIPRKADGTFLPGKNSPRAMGIRSNKGVGGRALALMTLDKMMARAKNQTLLDAAFQKDFENDPVRFFRQLIMPLIPQEFKVKMQEEGIFACLSLPSIFRTMHNVTSTLPEITASEPCAADVDGARPFPQLPKSSIEPKADPPATTPG